MIKVSCNMFYSVYVNIFNLILKLGVYPSLWRENFIKPLFKGGCINDPSCYRGIAISSCLSKFFTRIMFNRLDKYLEQNNIICSEQIGFRKGARTSDHIFTLKTVIDNYFKKNKYLFACFVDLKKAFDTVNREALLSKLFNYNIRGNFFNVLKDMYNNVTFSVKLTEGVTDSFQSTIGVKQGCILSPSLFSLYMNDLVDNFDAECDPVYLNEKQLSCLLYADDIVLLSQSAKGLQKLLDSLKAFCDMWDLTVNIDKTKIMIFNKSGKILKGYSFKYDKQPVELACEYKYLGIIFKPSGSFSYAINQLSKKACKAMFCIRRSLYSENMNVLSHIRLFDACVTPILLYCSEIWALSTLVKGNLNIESKYDSFIPNTVQVKFSKYILGVHKSATNIAALAELGLFPLSLVALKSSVSYWLHLLNANDKKLIYFSYRDNISVKDSLSNKLKTFLHLIGFGHIWDNQGTFSKSKLLHSIKKKLETRYIDHWKNLLFRENDSSSGGNKLRTYRKLKTDFDTEKYLFADVSKSALSSFVKIRISNSNLYIERGRYLKMPVESRICKLCENEVEDEFHFIMSCPALTQSRQELFENITFVVPSFSNMSDCDKFKFILNSNDLDICKICISGVHKMYCLNQSLKQDM